MKSSKLLQSKVTVLLLLLTATGVLLFRISQSFRIPLLEQSLRLIKDKYLGKAFRPDSSGQENSLVKAFVGEDSPAKDVPEMAYMRKVGRLSGLPLNIKELKTLKRKELVYIYHSYLDNIEHVCHRKLRAGVVEHGGWEICDDYAYRPIRPCIVYSFGHMYHQFSFEDEIAKLYDCEVYAFDASFGTKNFNKSSKVHFYKLGIPPSFPRKTRPNLKTLSEIRSLLHHQDKVIDVLKLDVELGEWRALPDILTTGQLGGVRQLLIEFHTAINDTAVAYRRRLKILARIETQGFRRFYTRMLPCEPTLFHEYPIIRSTAYEVYFVNTKMARPEDKK